MPATAAPATPGPAPIQQAPSFSSSTVPEQTAVHDAYRFTVEAAVRGAELPQLTLPATGSGDWVVLIVQAENWSDQPAELAIGDLQLRANGQLIPPDPGSGAVATFLGFSPAYESDQRVIFSPGEAHELALVYQVASNATSLTLVAGNTAISLGHAFAKPVDVTDLGQPPGAPSLLEARATRVIDGQTIEVEVSGSRQQVRYLGIAAPTGNACGAAQATAANGGLVAGQTVWLERESTDTNDAGQLLRDVWVANANGDKTLVAAQLAAAGAAKPAPHNPDIRYAGWIQAAATAAQSQHLGLWGACGG